jgi:hypothetical protein
VCVELKLHTVNLSYKKRKTIINTCFLPNTTILCNITEGCNRILTLVQILWDPIGYEFNVNYMPPALNFMSGWLDDVRKIN